MTSDRNRLIPYLTACAVMAGAGLAVAYSVRSLLAAATAIVLWLIVCPLVGLGLARRRDPWKNLSRRWSLLATIFGIVVAGIVDLVSAYRHRDVSDAVAVVMIFFICGPLLVVLWYWRSWWPLPKANHQG